LTAIDVTMRMCNIYFPFCSVVWWRNFVAFVAAIQLRMMLEKCYHWQPMTEVCRS